MKRAMMNATRFLSVAKNKRWIDENARLSEMIVGQRSNTKDFVVDQITEKRRFRELNDSRAFLSTFLRSFIAFATFDIAIVDFFSLVPIIGQ